MRLRRFTRSEKVRASIALALFIAFVTAMVWSGIASWGTQ